MTIRVQHDKLTDVAFVDVCEQETAARVDVIDVSDDLGLKCQVLARIDNQSGQLLGLIIEDYSAFTAELRKKYLSLAVEKMIDLLVSKVREAIKGISHGQRELSLA